MSHHQNNPAAVEQAETIKELFCPWCGNALAGFSVAAKLNGEYVRIVQTRRIGRRDYVFDHRPDGCHVPALDRLDWKNAARKAGLLPAEP